MSGIGRVFGGRGTLSVVAPFKRGDDTAGGCPSEYPGVIVSMDTFLDEVVLHAARTFALDVRRGLS